MLADSLICRNSYAFSPGARRAASNAGGLENAEIAKILAVSPWTVARSILTVGGRFQSRPSGRCLYALPSLLLRAHNASVPWISASVKKPRRMASLASRTRLFSDWSVSRNLS